MVFEAVVVSLPSADKAKLEVNILYKGDLPHDVEVTFGGPKGFGAFVPGKRYLVWARRSDGELFVHLCGPTHELPPPKPFTEGPWKGWSVEKQFGPARPPQNALDVEPTASSSAAPRASATPSPASTRSAAVQVTPLPEAPGPEPVTPPPPEGGGCAGCTVGSSKRTGGALLFALLAMSAVATRRHSTMIDR